MKHAVHVELGDRSYDIYIESNSLDNVSQYIQQVYNGNNIAVISDETVADLYAEKVVESLKPHFNCINLITFPAGEKSKSYTQLQLLHTELLERGFKRDSLIIALGGGVTGDLVGFAAATFLRGVDFVQIPTTILSQVDSSVGGKVGINHPLGKNLVGNFYQPKSVLIDTETLKTLPEREIWAGMAEVIKYGLIWDASFFNFIHDNLDDLIGLKNSEILNKAIQICCQIKAEVVRQDEKEGGLRRILNFGHTLGHAIEANTEFATYHHGEAVLHGMRWAAWVSYEMKFIDQATLDKIESVLKLFKVPPLAPQLDPSVLLDKMKMDKKQTEKGLNLVLLDRIGQTKIITCDDIYPLIEGWLNHV